MTGLRTRCRSGSVPRRMAMVCALLFLIGDEEVRAQVGAATGRDSAGVLVVENPPMGGARIAFRFDKLAQLDLGGLQDNENLEFKASNPNLTAVRLAGGGVVVADQSTLKFFGARGELLRVVGRSGGGPGEFVSMEALCRIHGDSVVVYDNTQRRFTVYSSRGEIARVTVVPGTVGQFPCFADGAALVRGGVEPGVSGRGGLVKYVIIMGDGGRILPLGYFPDDMFGLITKWVSVVTRENETYVGDPTVDRIGVYGRDGKLKKIVKTGERPTPVSDADIQEAIRSATPRGLATKSEGAFRNRLLAMPRSAVMPTYDRMFVDDSSRMWVRLPPHVGQLETWVVFGRDSHLQGKMLINYPANATFRRLVRVAGNEGIVRYLDDDGAAHLAFIRILRVP